MTRRDRKRAEKKKLAEPCEAHPHVKEALKIREKCGRPRLEADQPELLKAIVDIAIHGSAAHENRHSDVYHSIKTLDELTAQLKLDGFSVSRSGVYLRLLPKRSSTLEGKRVLTAPVKLIHAQNDSHLKHIDGQFCVANIKRLEELSSFLGPLEVCFISQDDKARVPIGLTAANKQSPLIMHVKYKVSLPDHNWVVAARHKLILSVYAGIDIQKDGLGRIEAVGYPDPTYVAIRSGKHATSTAYSHGLDFERLLELPEFDKIMKFDNSVKPVVVFVVDGGPGENPRYQKTIQVGVHHFHQNNLDALFIAGNAPGRSAFNRVERRMAPLSKELSGLILPHEQYGSHLDAQGNTINPKLEEKNFECAGKCLVEVCTEFFTIVPSRFLPIPVCQTVEGLKAPINRADSENYKFPSLFAAQILKADELLLRSVESSYKVLPYDLYCPSVQSVLPTCVCKHCGLYFASNVMLKKHIIGVHKITGKCQPEVGRVRPLRIAARRQQELMAVIAFTENVELAEWVDEDDIDIRGLTIPEDESDVKMPVYSINEHISSPWEEEL
ncbi:hypothetical protein AVEN_206775-1 [Araneus ventricosus]|uniref:C2H2-type domain-containing protein n=1 Tax=Araneus ventricosus TaxID=182803 RepID=A0A4Y2C4S9_ARAVE|nr:hypothetical protein AVEN_206775-1 [Araneus ventricosus]